MTDLTDFRAETRAWLEENCPDGARGAGPMSIGSRKLDLGPELAIWLERMAERGWTVPTWPKEYGGAELDRDEYRVLVDELVRINARTPLTGRGVNYIGPTLLEYGTDDQPVPPEKQATEVFHFKLWSTHSPYGFPRWIGNTLAVLGSRASEEVNFATLKNNNVPSYMLLVSGGTVPDATIDRITEKLEKEGKI